MHDAPTNQSPCTPDMDGANTESLCVVGCAGICQKQSAGACGNACDADRRNALLRQKILDKALIFAAKLRKHDHAVEVTDAWEQFTDAVDELVGAK